MRWETSLATTPAEPAANRVEMLAFAGGVQWLGMPAEDPRWRQAENRSDASSRPAILGSAHGPRLLELVAAAG
jgi:hypothetical protein